MQSRIRQAYWEYVNNIFEELSIKTGANNKNIIVVNGLDPSLNTHELTK